jgi:hypothetical protein
MTEETLLILMALLLTNLTTIVVMKLESNDTIKHINAIRNNNRDK